MKPRKPQLSLIHHFRRLYVHRTCGTDTKQMEFVFNALADIIMESTLSQIGLSWKQEDWKSTHDSGFYNRCSDKQIHTYFFCIQELEATLLSIQELEATLLSIQELEATLRFWIPGGNQIYLVTFMCLTGHKLHF